MRVFVTGGTGFIGAAVIQALRRRGHEILGLARSDAAAAALEAAGAEAHRGDLRAMDRLTAGAAACDAVIHLGFIHDFSRFAESCALDHQVVLTLGAALRGTDRPLVITSGTALAHPGRLATEADRVDPAAHPHPRAATEAAVDALAAEGIRASVVRCAPSVHGPGDGGFVPLLIDLARQRGVSAYIEDGANRWSAVHRLDAAEIFAEALRIGEAGERFHASTEHAIPFAEIAQAIGAGLGLPTISLTPAQAAAHFGWFAGFAGLDCPADDAQTRRRLGWQPVGATLLDDLASGAYFPS